MKSLFDLIPLLVFFAGYYGAKAEPAAVGEVVAALVGVVGVGAPLPDDQVPLLFATLLTTLATLGQVLVLMLLGRKVDKVLWVSLVLMVLMAMGTLIFHDPTIIKWRSSILDWLFGLTLLGSELLLGKNLIRAMAQGQLELPEPVWRRLNLSWVGFFFFSGLLNLYVAFNFSEQAWVNFNTFGGLGLMLVFLVAQGLYLVRHMPAPNEPG